MQMLMFVVESSHKDRIEAALREHEVIGYTEIPTVYGIGRSGPRLGSGAFPETSALILTVVETARVDALLASIDAECPDCRGSMRVVIWGVDRIV
jgi:hypothetical protein